MTAQVLRDVNADVQGVVEVDDRPPSSRFNQDLLGGHFEHVVLIDGNDTRGIDVGIMAQQRRDRPDAQQRRRPGYGSARRTPLQPRPCRVPFRLPNKRKVRVLLNHFKSQIGRWGPKRKRQAEGLRKIVNDLVDAGEKNLIVMGDLNEGPDGQGNPSQNFAPLYAPDSLSSTCSRRLARPGSKLGPSRVARRRTGSQTTSSSARTWRRRPWSGGGRAARPLGRADEQEPSERLGDLSHHHGVQPGSLRSRCDLRRPQHLNESLLRRISRRLAPTRSADRGSALR